ncbi:hypothetical protein [Enterococcus sp. CSURQ0835]|uniref:hypothetical protein n=1 Tax=Enterococcus sp. CSURQ0835 TaxID=2681394 RepID=UPI0013585E66|nr:hypothetical protein [Enterococcus sp. CSURQ0835]
MSYHLGEGLAVIFWTLLVSAIFLWLTRHVPWQKSELVLFVVASLNYLLDTIWWLFELHFTWSDLFFHYHGHPEQVTLFFILALVSFSWLVIKRGRRAWQHKK